MARRGTPVELSLDLPTKRSVFLRDPDRNLVEFFVPRKRDPGAPFAAPEFERYCLA